MSLDDLPLFSAPPPSAPKPITQDVELRRCVTGIGVLVLEFLRARLATAPEFRMEELRAYVTERAQCAPDSPRRVLGELGRQGWCEVSLLSRSGSLYRVAGVG